MFDCIIFHEKLFSYKTISVQVFVFGKNHFLAKHFQEFPFFPGKEGNRLQIIFLIDQECSIGVTMNYLPKYSKEDSYHTSNLCVSR